MVKSRQAQIILTAMIAVYHYHARAQEDSYYPHGALNNSFYQEQSELHKTEQMERDAIFKRDEMEKQKREVERQIAVHKFEIENLKNRQAKAQEELELIAVNKQHVNDQTATYEADQKKLIEDTEHTLALLKGERDDLQAKQDRMEKLLTALNESRKRSEREVYTKSMEMQRMKSENARLETKVAATEAKRAEMEADEMKVRTEWMQTKMASSDLQKQNDEATSQMNEAKGRWNQAQKELAEARTDLNRTQHQRDVTVDQVKTDVERYEREILAASKARIGSEAEQIRLASEAEKMKDYADRIRDTRDQASEQEADLNGMVLRTKVAVETARTELTKDVEGADRKSLIAEKETSKRRGLASAADATNLLGGSRIWATTTKCKAYKKPDKLSPAAGYFDSGRKLLGKDKDGGWVEITNGTGKSVFVESQCGEYQD